MGTLSRGLGLPDAVCESVREMLEPQKCPEALRELVGDRDVFEDIVTVAPEDWPKAIGCLVYLRREGTDEEPVGVLLRDTEGFFLRGVVASIGAHDFLLHPGSDALDMRPCDNLGPAHVQAWKRWFGAPWPCRTLEEAEALIAAQNEGVEEAAEAGGLSEWP